MHCAALRRRMPRRMLRRMLRRRTSFKAPPPLRGDRRSHSMHLIPRPSRLCSGEWPLAYRPGQHRSRNDCQRYRARALRRRPDSRQARTPLPVALHRLVPLLVAPLPAARREFARRARYCGPPSAPANALNAPRCADSQAAAAVAVPLGLLASARSLRPLVSSSAPPIRP